MLNYCRITVAFEDGDRYDRKDNKAFFADDGIIADFIRVCLLR